MERMREGCRELGIQITEEQEKKFIRYYELLVEWNQRVNLTSITDYEDVICKHFLDSLCIVKLKNFSDEKVEKFIDVGTGAGFPGIPVKIVYPDIQMTLLDSLNKRIKFLDVLKSELNLKGVTTLHARAEEAGRKREYREQFDMCVSRAVANLAVLSEYCIPLVRTGGNFITYKSGNVQSELQESKKAIELLGGEIKEKVNFTLPNSDMGRSLICIEKVYSTPGKYPRKSGIPGKSPLI